MNIERGRLASGHYSSINERYYIGQVWTEYGEREFSVEFVVFWMTIIIYDISLTWTEYREKMISE